MDGRRRPRCGQRRTEASFTAAGHRCGLRTALHLLVGMLLSLPYPDSGEGLSRSPLVVGIVQQQLRASPAQSDLDSGLLVVCVLSHVRVP